MGSKRDLLSECNDKGMPLDAFQKEWCSRCLTLECTRSIGGKSKFDARVSTWEDRLFLNPPIMRAEDPRFSVITAQKFLTIDVGRTPEVRSSWDDPRDLVEPQVVGAPQEPQTSQATPVTPPATVLPSYFAANVVEAPVEVRPPSRQNDTTSSSNATALDHLTLSNAPNQSGKVLPSPPSASIPKRDPWAAPASPDPADQIISPGSRVKLRGSGV